MATARTDSPPAQKTRQNQNWPCPCKHRRMLTLCLALFSVLAACSAQEVSQYTLGNVVFEEQLLPNGGRVLAFGRRGPTDSNMVSISVIFKAGEKYTPPGMMGLPHLAEHVAATDAFRKCIPGPHPFMYAAVMASTSYDDVILILSFEYQSAAIAAKNIELFKNALFHPAIASGQVEYEKGVIESEFFLMQTKKMSQSTGIVTHFVAGTTDLDKDVCGTRESLASVQQKDVQAFMEEHYSIDNAVIFVSVTGEDTMHAIPQIVEAFSALEPRGKREGEEEESKASVPQPPTLLLPHTPISPISPALQNKLLVVKSVSLRSSVYKKMLAINIFMPPVCFIQEEMVLSRIEGIFSGINPRTSSLLKSLEGHVCKLNFSRDLASMSFWSEKSVASVCIQLFLTDRGEKNIGAVLATVEAYAKETKAFIEENLEEFKKGVLIVTHQTIAGTANEMVESYEMLDVFNGMVMRGNGLKATEQLMDALEKWEEEGYIGMPTKYPGAERLGDYINAVLGRMADRSFWAISRISAEGSFARRVPYLINEEGRVEDCPNISDGERTAIENVVHRHFAWGFVRNEDGSTFVGHGYVANDVAVAYTEAFASKLGNYPKELSSKSLSAEIKSLSPEDLAAFDIKKEETRTTITTVAAPLRKMQFIWSFRSSNPPLQSCTLLLYTRAFQPDPKSAAASILHAMAALTRFTDRYSEGTRRHVDLSYEADVDGNLSIKLQASVAPKKDYVRASLQQFLDIYRSTEVYTEREADVAKNLAICAILEKCEDKGKYDFTTQRLVTALSTALGMREVLEAMSTVPLPDIAGAHIKAFEVEFNQFASLAESRKVYADIQKAFGIEETKELLRAEKQVDAVWTELWSLNYEEALEIRIKTAEINKNHVFFGIPVPPAASDNFADVLEDFCLRMNNYFDYEFLRPRLPAYYGHIYLYRVPTPSLSLPRYLLCLEASGMAPTNKIVSAIRTFLSEGTEYYIQHVFPIIFRFPASSPSVQELLNEFNTFLNRAGALIITEASSPK